MGLYIAARQKRGLATICAQAHGHNSWTRKRKKTHLIYVHRLFEPIPYCTTFLEPLGPRQVHQVELGPPDLIHRAAFMIAIHSARDTLLQQDCEDGM